MTYCEEFDDQTLAEVCQLNQLKSLDICHNDKITDEGFTKISNLTNLERLNVHHSTGIRAKSFDPLKKLPKLSNLRVHYSWDANQMECFSAVSIIGQLSYLTQLKISNVYGDKLDSGVLTNLTGLLDLEINRIQSANFAALSQLTRLDLRLTANFNLTTLSANLREFIISSISLNEDDLNTICSLGHLRSLKFINIEFDGAKLSKKITKLTDLAQLTIIPSVPKGMTAAFSSLTH